MHCNIFFNNSTKTKISKNTEKTSKNYFFFLGKLQKFGDKCIALIEIYFVKSHRDFQTRFVIENQVFLKNTFFLNCRSLKRRFQWSAIFYAHNFFLKIAIGQKSQFSKIDINDFLENAPKSNFVNEHPMNVHLKFHLS